MSTLSIKFDPISYIQKARKFGFTQEQAEFNAQELEHIVEQQTQILVEQNTTISDLKAKDLVTKGDLKEVELNLQKEIKNVELKIKDVELKIKSAEIRLMLLMASGFVAMIGVMAKGFRWW